MRRLCVTAGLLMLVGIFVGAPAEAQGTGGTGTGSASDAPATANLPAAENVPTAASAPAAANVPMTSTAPTAANATVAAGVSSPNFDPTHYIGLDVKSALDALGAPAQVFSFRGQDDGQDSVVFFYPDYLYLFWYRNRVWQVRCDKRFARPMFGVAMGMPREVIERTATRRLMAKGDSLFFDLEDAKYPLRVRLVFSNGALGDIYVYRSDF